MIDCGMCGHSFTREEGSACSTGCPMARGCGMVTCPSCGHEFPPDSKVVDLVTSLVRRLRPRPIASTQPRAAPASGGAAK